MESWNKLLKRQIWKHLGDKPLPQEVTSLLQAISDSYDQNERDHALLSRTMDLSSEELLTANRELRKRNEELDRFVYSTSHDLRAPLTSILGLLELIELTKERTSVDELLSHIKDSTIKLDNFIGDIVMYTRNKKTEIEYELIDFESLIFNCIEKLNFMPNSKSLEKSVNVNVKHDFYSDPHRLDNIFTNLISNSIKYSNTNTSKPFCDINVNVDQTNALIGIKDNGLGIDKKHISKIFNMFYRASRESNGSGIGLYIVKEMVEKLSGRITVQSEPGLGSEFKITLPNISA